MNPQIQTQVRQRVNVWRIAANGTSLLIFLCGCAAAVFARNLELALGLITIGALLDGVDGAMARRAGGATLLGAQLDVLADFSTFGVASAAIVLGHTPGSSIWLPVSLVVFLLASLARLLRSYHRGLAAHQEYIGLPMPASAMLMLSLSLTLPPELTFLGVLLTTALAISIRPYPTPGWFWRESRQLLFAGALIAVIICFFSYRGAMLFAGLSYAAFPWVLAWRNIVQR